MGNCYSSLASSTSGSRPALPVADSEVLPSSEPFHLPRQTPAHKPAQHGTTNSSPQSSGVTFLCAPSHRDKTDTSSPSKSDISTISPLPQPPPRTRSRQRRFSEGAPSNRTSSQQGTPTLPPCRISRSLSASLLDNVQRAKHSVKCAPFGIPRSALPFTTRAEPQIPFKAKGSGDSDDKRRCLGSTLQGIIYDDRFRILVLGKRGSGKSSLIKAVFKVDMSVAPMNASRNIVANTGFQPRDNHRLLVHEYSGLEPRDMQSIRDFITMRSQPNLPLSERLHAVWVCVSMLDPIGGMFEEGTKILGLGVPVVVVFTKFDLVVSKGLSNVASGDPRSHESARATAYEMSEGPYRAFTHKNSGGLPSEIVSTNPKFAHLIGSLIATTNQAITTHSSHAPASPKAQQVQPPMSPVQLAWSVSQRASRDVIIQATIDVGRSGYWRDLGISDDFYGNTLAKCVEVIHDDIVGVWNFPDKDRYLSSTAFKAEISHLVQDLCGRPIDTLSRSKPNGRPGGTITASSACWRNNQYQNSEEDICCVMGYIVDLTVVLYSLFDSTADVSPDGVRSVIKALVDSGRKTKIHGEIRSFVRASAPKFTYQGHDLIMERIIDLIKQFCVLPSSNSCI